MHPVSPPPKRRESPSEPLKRVIGLTVRAVAGDDEVNVDFAPGRPQIEGHHVQLPEPARVPTAREIAVVRGWADSLALTLACHDTKLHQKLAPATGDARAVYEAMERARVEAIGANRMDGMADNLAAKCEEQYAHGRFANVSSREEAPLEEALALIMRERLTGRPPPASAKALTDVWRPVLETRCGKTLKQLAAKSNDQEAFGRLVRELLRTLEMADKPQDGERDESEDEQEQNPDGGDQDTEGEEETNQGEQDAGQDRDTEGQEGDTTEASDAGEMQDIDSDSEGEAESDTAEPWRPNLSVLDAPEHFGYKIFSTETDEVVEAEKLSTPEELDRLRAFLDKELRVLASTVSRLANRLQRRLLAKQNRAWDFDLEEGALDPARLTRIIIDPMHALSFMRERDTDFRDTVVTLLIDNSGSMRGRPIMVAACCADILARTLERCGVKVEILGFTTKAWKGGEARERWLGRGQAPQPGTSQRPAPHHLQDRRCAVAPGQTLTCTHDARGPAEGKHRRRGADVGPCAIARPARTASHPDDDLGWRAGRRFHVVGELRQLPRAPPASGHPRNRDPLAGGADRHRHRPRRDAVLSPRGNDHRRQRTGRRHD